MGGGLGRNPESAPEEQTQTEIPWRQGLRFLGTCPADLGGAAALTWGEEAGGTEQSGDVM